MKKSKPTSAKGTPANRRTVMNLKRAALIICTTAVLAACNKKALTDDKKTAIASQTNKNVGPEVSATPGYYSIATYNIRRTATETEHKRTWEVRDDLAVDMVLKHSFDIFGVQEPMGPQIDYLIGKLDDHGYAKFGVSDHNDHPYQHQDIFYKTAKFTLKTSGKFWMAPGGPTSIPTDTTPWDSYYHACVCTWGKFQDKTTGREFFVFNTHFDPGGGTSGTTPGTKAREESGKLMLSKAQSIAGGLPSIIMGDFNSNQYQSTTTGPYWILQNSSPFDETWEIAGTKTPVSRQTGNWWNINPPGDSQIDHIFVSREAQNNWEVLNRKVLWDHYDNVQPWGYNDVVASDHFPVVSEMRMQAPTAHIANGKYKIVAQSSGMAMGVDKTIPLNQSAKVLQYNYTSAAPNNDQWNVTQIGTSGYYRITNVNSGMDMNVQGQSTVNSGAIIQYPYSADMIFNDNWSFIPVGNGYYRIVSRSSGLSLDVQGNSMAEGGAIIQYNYLPTYTNSHFQLVAVP